MKTVNTVSGGKTSAYIAANYDADYNVFSIVRTSDKNCILPDKKLRQIVSDKIGDEFIGTLEDDIIVNTILDLEQYIGKKIHWVSGKTFDDVLKTAGTVPDVAKRYCTTQMKLEPMFDWWRKEIGAPCEFRLGFRANETSRAKRTSSKVNENGFLEMKAVVGKYGTRKKWGMVEWQKPTYPLIEDNIYKDEIENFWKDKPVRFAWMNNCVGCFNKDVVLLRKMWDKYPEKLEWFASKERVRHQNDIFKKRDGVSYHDILKWNPQIDMFDDDFNECDSGYCGI